MEDNKKGNSIGLKVALGIALALFLGTGIYTMSLYSTSKETQKVLEEEKQMIIDDYKTLSGDYENILSENQIADENLVKANDSIQGLIESLKISEANVNTLKKYRRRYRSLLSEKKFLLARIDSLNVANSYLSSSLDSTLISLEVRKMFSDSLLVQNTALADVVENASVLTTAGLKGFGIIERSSGKLVPTEKAKRADKIRVCFTVAKNNLVQSGDQELYIQVLDPESNILGLSEEINLKKTTVIYSVISKFNYENKSLDVCEFVTSNEELLKGTYTVNVYNSIELVSNYEFTLR